MLECLLNTVLNNNYTGFLRN